MRTGLQMQAVTVSYHSKAKMTFNEGVRLNEWNQHNENEAAIPTAMSLHVYLHVSQRVINIRYQHQ